MVPPNNEVLWVWKDHLANDRELSPATIKTHASVINRLSVFAGKPFAEMTELDIKRFRSEAKSVGYRRLRSTVVRVFFRWLEDEYGVAHPAPNLSIPPRKKVLPKFVDNPEVRKLERVAKWEGPRSYALFCLFTYQGLRLTEALNLRWADISQGFIRVHGKGSKDRFVPIHPLKTKPALKALRKAYRGSEWLFPGRAGKPINPSTGQYIVRRWCKEAHLDEHIWPHRLRHTFATEANARGVNLPAIQSMMGHSDIKTTMIYTHVKPKGQDAEIRKLRF